SVKHLGDIWVTIAVFPHAPVSFTRHVGERHSDGHACRVEEVHADEATTRDGSPVLNLGVTPPRGNGIQVRRISGSQIPETQYGVKIPRCCEMPKRCQKRRL